MVERASWGNAGPVGSRQRLGAWSPLVALLVAACGGGQGTPEEPVGAESPAVAEPSGAPAAGEEAAGATGAEAEASAAAAPAEGGEAAATEGGPEGSPPSEGTTPGNLNPPVEDVHVFYIGHSLVGFRMPSMTSNLARSLERGSTWDAHIGIGANLGWIATQPQAGQGPPPLDALATGSWDTVVMTEAIDLRDQLAGSDTIRWAGHFYQAAVRANPDVRVYLYETWHFRDRDYDWRQRLTDDRRLWESIIDGVNRRHEGPDMMLVPAGTALAVLVDRIAAGQVPGVSSDEALFHDSAHTTDLGDYFVACVMFATLYRQSPVGGRRHTASREGVPYARVPEETARAFQEIAWEVVRQDPRAGVLRR
ncbi:MAG: hypothetical protein ACFCGT_26000 [Sandaracinaceae bacterium]